MHKYLMVRIIDDVRGQHMQTSNRNVKVNTVINTMKMSVDLLGLRHSILTGPILNLNLSIYFMINNQPV